MSNKLVKVPKLEVGNDVEVAEMLVRQHDKANDATRIIFDTGLLCFFIKSNLKQGEFGAWLQAHTPEGKMWRKNKKGKPVASSTLSWQMWTTNGLARKCKTTVGKLLSQIPKTWEFAHRGEFLQLPSGSELMVKAPEEVAKVHARATEIIEGKTAYQLFLEFKQADEDEEAPAHKPKRGRLKGSSGLTKEQRAKAAEREEQARIDGLKLDAADFAKWCDKNGDAKGIGAFRGSKEWNKLKEAVETLAGYMRGADAAATGGQQ